MPAPARKAPAKRAAAKKPATAKVADTYVGPAEAEELSDQDLAALADEPADPEPGEVQPVIIGKRGRRGNAPVQMVTIFEVDDVPYQIPRNPSAALVLSWLFDTQKVGRPQANVNMALELLGEAPFSALKRSPDTEPEDLNGIFENIGIVFFASENYRKIMAAPDPS